MNSGGLAENGVTLGNEEYFVLGDNRNNSEDSRFTDVGNIPARAVMGKVWLIVSPLSSFGFID
jgi:signal peptidase I